MPAMLARAAFAILLVTCTVACNMWSKPAKGWSGATGGENIEKLFWDDVANKNFAKVEAHIASSFSGSGPAGPMERDAFLQQLHSSSISAVTLSGCTTHLNGADLIIACVAQRAGANPEKVSTLSVWQEYKKGWLMVAHSEAPAVNQ